MLIIRLLVLTYGSSLLFAVTTVFSVYGVIYQRKNGSLPEYSVQDADRLPIEAHDFSMETGDKLNDRLDTQHHRSDERPYTQTNIKEQTHPGGPITWNLQQPHAAPAELGDEAIDPSYYGSRQRYESSQRLQSQITFDHPDLDPRYDMGQSNNSQVMGGLKPIPMQNGGHPSRQNLVQEYDHGGYGSGGTVNFPEGNYGR